jgi:branched-chain amino acid transport system ATP-binding protein
MMLEVDKLTKAFGGVHAVRGASLRVAAGELVGFIGPNGAGKTTFARLVTGLLQPNAGSVRFKGVDVTAMPMERRARLGIALTHQIVRPWRGISVLENIMVAAGHRSTASAIRSLLRVSKKAEREIAMAILARVGLVEIASKDPDVLPLGMLKRLEVARAVALQPSLVVLDEPLAGLNQREASDLSDVILDLNEEGMTVVLVEHNLPEVMRIAKRLVVFDVGTVIADGDPQTIIADAAVRKAYLGDVGDSHHA